MDLLRERLKARGAQCAVLRGGGGGNSSSQATTETNNVDQRQAVQDGIAVNGTGNVIEYNSSDAVKALAAMGADVIKNSGGAVVELFKENTKTFDATAQTSLKLVDKLIDGLSEGFGVANKAIDSFQPAENKNTDAIKWAAIAAGVTGIAYLFKDSK